MTNNWTYFYNCLLLTNKPSYTSIYYWQITSMVYYWIPLSITVDWSSTQVHLPTSNNILYYIHLFSYLKDKPLAFCESVRKLKIDIITKTKWIKLKSINTINSDFTRFLGDQYNSECDTDLSVFPLCKQVFDFHLYILTLSLNYHMYTEIFFILSPDRCAFGNKQIVQDRLTATSLDPPFFTSNFTLPERKLRTQLLNKPIDIIVCLSL